VERVILEPGGTFAISRKSPPADEVKYQEVIRRLDELSGKLDRLAPQQSA
jgi:hypothetical protein